MRIILFLAILLVPVQSMGGWWLVNHQVVADSPVSSLIAAVDCYQNDGEPVDTGIGNVTATNITHAIGHDSVANAAVYINANNDVYSFSANETDGTLDPDVGTITFYYRHVADVENGILFSQNVSLNAFRVYRSGLTDNLYFVLNADNSVHIAPSALFDGNWHTLRFTWDHPSGTRVLYVDDVEVADVAAQPNNWTSIAITTGSMKIGDRSDGLYASNAEFQDFKIYNEVVTP